MSDASGAPAPTSPSAHPPSDARQRLLLAALRLFSSQGVAKTSTRQIAEAAGVNLAAIRYYFGDKEGLHRAAFFEPLGQDVDQLIAFADPALSLQQALRLYYQGWVTPFNHGEVARQSVTLHLREMLDPTGLWAHEVEHVIQPMHHALCQVLCRALGVTDVDTEVHRLAMAVSGLGVHLHTGCDIAQAVCPPLVPTADNADATVQHLVRYAEALIDGERRRRHSA